ncbi:MAG: hypothetical protein ACFFDP_01525 [Promethearchaeota archaeon]
MTIEPIFASSIFTISMRCQVYQVLCYDYADSDGLYAQILQDEEAFAKETEMLRENMKRFLDAEKVYINGERVQQQILHVDIGLRGAADLPYIQWVIFFQGSPKKGENVLASDVEEEIVEYDLEVLYLLPRGTGIIQVQTPMEYEVREHLLFVWSRKGDKVGGHEEVVFQLPS